MSEKMVTVCMITYNHEAYISEAIEGVLMQKTNFAVELIIGEDYSTDRTREICLDYQQKHPDKIKLLLNEQNLGATQNFVKTLQACSGKYIAICEGDDFWIDPLKLQKQIDFLENNEEFAICFHDVALINMNSTETESYQIKYEQDKDVFYFEDLLYNGNLMHTPSVVFRKQEKLYPEIEAITGDYFLHLHNASYGKIKLVREKMACYRVHETGVFSNRHSWNLAKKLEFFSIQAKAVKFLKENYSIGKTEKIFLNKKIHSLLNNKRIYALIQCEYKVARQASYEQLMFLSEIIRNPKTLFGVILTISFSKAMSRRIKKQYHRNLIKKVYLTIKDDIALPS